MGRSRQLAPYGKVGGLSLWLCGKVGGHSLWLCGKAGGHSLWLCGKVGGLSLWLRGKRIVHTVFGSVEMLVDRETGSGDRLVETV